MSTPIRRLSARLSSACKWFDPSPPYGCDFHSDVPGNFLTQGQVPDHRAGNVETEGAALGAARGRPSRQVLDYAGFRRYGSGRRSALDDADMTLARHPVRDVETRFGKSGSDRPGGRSITPVATLVRDDGIGGRAMSQNSMRTMQRADPSRSARVPKIHRTGRLLWRGRRSALGVLAGAIALVALVLPDLGSVAGAAVPTAPQSQLAVAGYDSAQFYWYVGGDEGTPINSFVIKTYMAGTTTLLGSQVVPAGAVGSALDPSPGALDMYTVTGLTGVSRSSSTSRPTTRTVPVRIHRSSPPPPRPARHPSRPMPPPTLSRRARRRRSC